LLDYLQLNAFGPLAPLAPGVPVSAGKSIDFVCLRKKLYSIQFLMITFTYIQGRKRKHETKERNK